MKTISLRLERDEYKSLKATSEQFGLSMASFVRLAAKDKCEGVKSSNLVEELSDQVVTEFQAMRNELTSMKRELSQTLLANQAEKHVELSKQLNSAFAFELDRMQNEIKHLLIQVLSSKSLSNFPSPTKPPSN